MSTRADEPRTFDHSAIAALPEYHDARVAIDALADALDRMAGPRLSRAQFVEAVADMVRTSYAANVCQHCAEHTPFVPSWPHAATVQNGWMIGTYRCPVTGRTWTCSYAVP